MFGRATIRLGIGPHSSLHCVAVVVIFSLLSHMLAVMQPTETSACFREYS